MYKSLTWEMTKSEVTDRYRGQILGWFWAILHPLILIGVYIFIFVVIFKIRIGGTREMPLDYTTYLLSGLIPWLTVQEVMSKAGTAITSNANLVKQVVFPIEILPIKSILASLITQGIFLSILIMYVLATNHSLPFTYIFLPLLFFIQMVGMAGISFTLSAIGVYFKDVKDIVQMFTLIGIYLLPIFYLPEQVPEQFRLLLFINPFSYMVWCYQDVLYLGRFDHPWAWVAFIVMSHFSFTFGYNLFRKLKIMFGNVL
ncbi:ABC transporter permease [Pseudanabaena galeata UHCC 0370]|uniref:Transport permease protein n=2 Tax=Pseudanabaena TaxID=1152 RepID=A0ABU5TD80_9CYAN|nr:ABC transporter permease [Pseudanabaena galeata]MEA5476231.1 ABC transporter permease [Pseudanabaena galeata UHCC 0370]MEA5488460.1 ABC transporter permease [Pseudanabaena sp. CCNP1317]WGS74262.1 ABC transporter permease [Pseudanabaena galeata CCNP1313]